MTKQTANPKLAEARKRWGAARVLTGHPKPKAQPHPTTPPAAPAVALAA